jgi:hypothetical protein
MNDLGAAGESITSMLEAFEPGEVHPGPGYCPFSEGMGLRIAREKDETEKGRRVRPLWHSAFDWPRHLSALAAAAVSIAGCATKPFVAESIPARMKAEPEAYRRVGILSLSLTSQAATDSSLTTNDLKVLNRRVGTNLLDTVTRVLSDKGYRVTCVSLPLCTAEDWEALDQETHGLATEVRTNLLELSEEIYANRPNEKFHPADYRVPPCVAELGRKMGQQDTDLFVLLDSSVYLETPEAQRKRNKWNWTGGALLTPLVVGIGFFGGAPGGPEMPIKNSPAWTSYAVLIADAHSLEVLFWNTRTFLHEDARNTGTLRAELRDLLANLAELPRH